MNVLIIEDERHNADRLTRLLNSSFDDITVYGPLPSIADIRRFFNEPERINFFPITRVSHDNQYNGRPIQLLWLEIPLWYDSHRSKPKDG